MAALAKSKGVEVDVLVVAVVDFLALLAIGGEGKGVALASKGAEGGKTSVCVSTEQVESRGASVCIPTEQVVGAAVWISTEW